MIISNSLPCLIFKGPFLITQGYMDTDLLFSLKATDKPPTKELRWIITTAREGYTISGYLENMVIRKTSIDIILTLTKQEEEEYNAIQKVIETAAYWNSTMSNYTKPANRILELYEAISNTVDWSERHRYLIESIAAFLTCAKQCKNQDTKLNPKLLAEIKFYSLALDILNFRK